MTPLPVEKRFFLGYTCIGEDFVFEGEEFAASKKDFDFAVGFMSLAEELLSLGRLRNHPISVDSGGEGLNGILQGLQLLKEGKVSGQKLVYVISNKD